MTGVAASIVPGKTRAPGGTCGGVTIERIRLLGGGGAYGLGAGASGQPNAFVLNPERLGYHGVAGTGKGFGVGNARM